MARIALQKVGMKDGLPIYSPISMEDVKHIGEQEILVADMKSGKSKRSGLQNSAMHLYFEMLSTKLNGAGFDMVATMIRMSKGITLPWTANAVKERLWLPVMAHTFGTESTTKLEPDQVSIVHEALTRATCEKLQADVSVNFPDRFMKMYERDEDGQR